MIDYTNKRNAMELLGKLISPLLKFFEEEIPYIELPVHISTSYSEKTQLIESFARMLWGASFADESILSIEIRKRLVKAIANGTDPHSKWYWGTLSDYSQVAVEMTPIAFFVYRNANLFHELDENSQDNIANWLYQINEVKLSNNNWQCFIVLVNTFLALLGKKHSEYNTKNALENIERMYLSNGWYSDGQTNQRDYYISFAIHYYLLMYHLYANKHKETFKYLERSITFSESFIYWFSDDGSALPFGRSLIYRFAQIGFWALLAANDIPAEKKKTCKGIIRKNLAWWMCQPIWDNDGLLSLGYTYPNQLFLEYYNSSGSPFWALKGFAFLLIPDNDVFWEIAEVQAELKKRVFIEPARMLVCRNNGYSYAFVNGQNACNAYGHTECKYEKFVYSSHAAFCVSKSYTSLNLLAPDNTLAISLNGHDYFSRTHAQMIKNSEKCQISVWEPTSSIRITTTIIPNVPGHLRIHKIDTNESLVIIDGGFAIPNDSGLSTSYHDGIVTMSIHDCTSAACSLVGGGEPITIDASPNCNIMFKKCSIPAVKYQIRSGKYLVVDWFYDGPNEQTDIEKSLIYEMKNNVILYQGDMIALEQSDSYKRPYPVINLLKKIKSCVKRLKKSM